MTLNLVYSQHSDVGQLVDMIDLEMTEIGILHHDMPQVSDVSLCLFAPGLVQNAVDSAVSSMKICALTKPSR